MKKYILMASVAILTFGITAESWAETTCTWDGTKLTIDGSGEFSGCPDGSNHKSATEVTIGTGVTSIGVAAFQGASSLTSITIPDSVTSIGPLAFQFASSLTSITIPEGVTSIGYQAFQFASSLTSITIPDSVTSIGWSAFTRTSSLTNIICKGDIEKCKNNFAKIGLADLVVPAKDKQCYGSNYYWSGTSCNNKRGGDYV